MENIAWLFPMRSPMHRGMRSTGITRVPPVAGDANGDGRVNGADLGLFSAAFNGQVGQAQYDPAVDWNGDGRVNGADLAVFSRNFNHRLEGLAEPAGPFSGGGSGAGRSSAVDHFFTWFSDEKEEDSTLGLDKPGSETTERVAGGL